MLDQLTALLIKGLARLPWSWALGFGSFVGGIIAAIPIAKPHRIARINLALCCPDLSEIERHSLAKKSMVLLGKNTIAGAVSWIANISSMKAKISSVENAEIVDQAIEMNRGVIFISPHLGCFEFLNFYLCSHYDLVIIAKPFAGPAVGQLMQQGRSRLRGSIVATSEKGVRALYSTLKRGGMTLIAPDHVPSDSGGIFAPFFGISTTTGILPSRLVQKTGARVVAVTCTLKSTNTFQITFLKPDDDVYASDLTRSVSALNATLQRCIEICPEQYQWGYRRFKKIQGAASPY